MTDTESTISTQNPLNTGSNPPPKKKRNLPGTPDPEAEVTALSPKTLMATNRFVCEVCGKGFQRDQNLQLHRRGHNLPWKLKQRSSKEVRKRVYVCPEKACVHHHPSRALGDLTGIKKHFCRKHGQKNWKCDKCAKRYAVQSDWKAHAKTCGTREYKCDCGTIFSRRDSFITHRAFCDALAQESLRVRGATHTHARNLNYEFQGMPQHIHSTGMPQDLHPPFATNPSFSNLPPSTFYNLNWDFTHNSSPIPLTNHKEATISSLFSTHQNQTTNHQAEASARMSATALLQKAAQIGATTTTHPAMILGSFGLNGAVQDGNRLCGLYSTSSVTSGFGSDVESSVNENSAMNGHPQMYPSSKRRRLQSHDEMAEGGETRDFLGVGICHPPSINGWI
ncbi:zinc finger protein NUTCRACKER-like [Salvia miltiorrhiza]|uniref:zinc finger protein NUTCRACKER-like n=1 Tax=Salvia miltiorrhiza TaxID=226208 RepID=UPI0025AB7259|nr:zinc finger protein NUTCRACKER-like [Salvia miltiorrhiza]